MALTASMDRRHGDKECLFGGRIASYGRVWRKVSESDAWIEALTQTPITGLRHPSSNHCHNWLGRCRKAMLGVWHWPGSLPEGFVPPWPRWLCSGCVALPWCRWWHTSSGSVQTFLLSSCWPAWWRYNYLVMWLLWLLGLLRCYMLSILSITPYQSPQFGWSVSNDTNCLIYIWPHTWVVSGGCGTGCLFSLEWGSLLHYNRRWFQVLQAICFIDHPIPVTPILRDSSVVWAPDSWSKGRGFESLQERRENFLLQGQLSVLTLISVSVPPPVLPQ